MRLWSIHPGYLDSKGLVALWREGLLAQKILLGKTKGYKNHPQLIRFKNTKNPVGAIASYLRWIFDEGYARGYKFNNSKIVKNTMKSKMPVTNGQIVYEFNHLLKKLKVRNPTLYEQLKSVKKIGLHPMFKEIIGDVEDWEKSNL